jgi:PTH2 family peptidyl-tRNA hydrolase
MTYKIKQVIVIRKDLNMRKGKIAAQAAHASMKVFLDRASLTDTQLSVDLNQDMYQWLKESFAKICLYVETEQELDDIYNKALSAGLPASIIVDSGRTEFKNIPTKTCIAIGPAKSEAIDEITGGLKLL